MTSRAIRASGCVAHSPHFPTHYLAAVHLVLSLVVLLWDIWVAGRTAQLRSAPRAVALASGMAGLLLVPALTVYLLSGSLLTGRAFASIAWVWPMTAALVAAQAVLVAVRRLATPAVAVPIAIYNVLLALVYAAGYGVSVGHPLTTPLAALVAAHRTAMAVGAQPLALFLPWYLYIPIIAPCTRGRPGAALPRAVVAMLAVGWTALLLSALPPSVRAVRSYERYSTERLRERPEHDFTIGLKVFPTLSAGPPSIAIQRDLALADSINAQALSIYVTARGASESALSALAASLEDARTGRRIIVALDLSSARLPSPRHPASPAAVAAAQARFLGARVVDVARIARVLQPDYLIPVVDPAGAAALGAIEVRGWESYLANAARAAHIANPGTRVMAHVGSFGAPDSALYAWATSSAAPVDAVAITLLPGLHGGDDLDARERTADSWLSAERSTRHREHWILEAGGFPMAHGDLSQARALWEILSWATNRPAFKGVVVLQASDYTAQLGLATAAGRYRLAAGTVARAIAGLGE